MHYVVPWLVHLGGTRASRQLLFWWEVGLDWAACSCYEHIHVAPGLARCLFNGGRLGWIGQLLIAMSIFILL